MDRPGQRFAKWQDIEIALPSDLVAWRVLCDECEKFLKRETQIVRATRKEPLLADCLFDSTPSVGRATMLELRSGPDELLKTQLETWATKAAIAIGCPRAESPLKFWLCKLFVYLQKTGSKHLFASSSSVEIGDSPQSDLLKPDAGKIHSSVGGIITNVWEASLNFGVWIEKQALEAGATAQDSPTQNTDIPAALESSPASWSEIEITFLSDERVEICSEGSRKTYNYDELGFVDRRSGKPNRAWTTLREMASGDGTIPQLTPGKGRAMIEKRIEEIRKKLRGHFKIGADPIPFNGNTYKTSFKINRRPSFDS